MLEAKDTGNIELPVGKTESEKLTRINWMHEIPHSDGGMIARFGLVSIRIPQSGGQEVVQRERDGRLRRFFSSHSPYLVGGKDGLNFTHTRLSYDGLLGHERIDAFLSDNPITLEGLDPERINAVGNLIEGTDRAKSQDDASREILEIQRNLVNLLQRHVRSGTIDPSDETMKSMIEAASIHLQTLEATRKVLPARIRELIPQAAKLGVDYILERKFGRRGREVITLDPASIAAVYTPASDNFSSGEFVEHSRKVLGDVPGIQL